MKGVISSKHSSMASNPEFAPNRENQGVQMWAGNDRALGTEIGDQADEGL